MWPSFVNTALLAGLAALAIPVIIHLLLKIRQRKLRFSTLRFFDQQDEQSVRRRKVRHWLLLGLRLLLLALLVLSFARPYQGGRASASGKEIPTLSLFIVDRSASMLARDREGERFSRALAAMEKTIASLDSRSQVLVISCGAEAELLGKPGSPSEALKIVANLRPMEGPAQLRNGLQLAVRLVSARQQKISHVIHVVSDLQSASCRELQRHPLPREAAVTVMNFGDRLAPNLAITELQASPGPVASAQLVVANFSDELSELAKVSLLIDGREIRAETVQLAANETKTISVPLPALVPGWHDLEARLEAADALALDNRRWHTLFVPPPIRVLAVESRQNVRVFEEETFFFRAGLDPALGSTNSPPAGFVVEKTALENLADNLRLAGGTSVFDVVLLPGVKRLPGETVKALRNFVTAGGGLFLFLGDAVSANHYNTELADLLPAPLGIVETASELDWRLWEWERQSPVFAAFRQPHSGNLSLARFGRRFSIPAASPPAILARFQDGVPCLLYRRLGQGRVLMFNSTANTDWNDWPKHKTFVPWLHCSVRHLAGRAETTPDSANSAQVTGSGLQANLGNEYRLSSFRLITPTGKQLECQTDDAGLLLGPQLDTAGIYSLRLPDGREIRRWAANLTVAESDLAALSPSEFQLQIVRRDMAASSPAGWFSGQPGEQREWWRTLLLAGLLLMLLETIVGNRTTP